MTFLLRPEVLRFTRADGKFGLETGDYRVFVGPNAATNNAASFRLIVPQP